MKINDIPVRVIGPGSQPVAEEEENLSYIDMPGDMSMFEKPAPPEPDEFAACPGAHETMQWLRGALREYVPGGEPLLANLDALDEASRALVNQLVGEGEVSINADGDARARTQESLLAGVWRTVYLDEQGKVRHDILEVAEIPHVLRFELSDAPDLETAVDSERPDMANSLALLVEVAARREAFAADGTSHTINLSLLPLSDPELEYLDATLGRGPVDVLSRSYGKCQVISTAVPDVWWVRHYNSMGKLILNLLEIVDVPEVVKAAPEDLDDSATRLDEILEPYWTEVA